jgi:hypothetical protein
MKSGMPSPVTSAAVDPCGCEKVTPPAFFVAKLSMIMWRVNEMFPAASRFCSNHARPKTCAWSTATTSFRPSPLTSNTDISPPPSLPRPVQRENDAGWYFHSPVCPAGGCSHHP